MVADARGISSYIEKIALNSEASVHSVYERTVNIALSSPSMLAIQKESSPVSPLTLLIDDNSLFFSDAVGLEPGAELKLASDNSGCRLVSLEMPGICINIPESVERFDTKVPAAKALSDYLAFVSYISNISKDQASGSDDLVRLRADQIKADAKSMIAESRFAEAADCLTGLIGLGGGLTPAGDDFITGFITGIHSMYKTPLKEDYVLSDDGLNALRDSLFAEVRIKASDTNDISSAFLHAALDGHTSLPLKGFLANPSRESIDDISRIGHTSGMDALEGLLYFFEMLRTK